MIDSILNWVVRKGRTLGNHRPDIEFVFGCHDAFRCHSSQRACSLLTLLDVTWVKWIWVEPFKIINVKTEQGSNFNLDHRAASSVPKKHKRLVNV